MNKFRTGWYLIYTKPRHERKVHSRLLELQINSFLPTKKTLRTWHDRRKFVDEPLFPSYVFIHLKDIKNYYEGMNTEGSLYYIRLGKEIARVSDAVVNNLMVVAGNTAEVEVSAASFLCGQKVTIQKGPLAGLSGEIVRVRGKQRLLIRVDLLQRHVLLTLTSEYLFIDAGS